MPKEIILARWGETGSCRGLTYKERMQLLVDAARQGDAEALQRLSRSLGCLPNEDVLRAAAAAGHGEACDWLLTQKCAMRDDGAWVLAVAAAAGHTEICDKLYRARLQLHKSYMARLAARAGQSDVLTRLGQRPWGHPIADETAERAGLPGDLQEAWWACAAHAGHLELMLKLKGRGYDPGNLPAVAHGCPLAVLQTMIRECLPMYRAILNSERVAAGIMAGAVSSPTPDWRDKVTWLLTEWRRAPIHTLDRHPARDFAALPDALQRLQWLDGLGFGLRSCQQLLRAAVEAGREELVGTMEVPAAAGYAGDGRRASLPNAADASLITLAVTEGHLGIAKELRAQGVFAHVRDLLGPAGATGRVDVVQWVLGVMREEEEQEQEQGRKAAAKTAQGSTATAEGMGAASNEEQRRGPQQVSGCGGEGQGTGQIESNRVSPGEQLVVRPPSSTITESKMPIVMELTDAACGSGSLQLVQWLRAQGVPWGPGQLGMAAKSGNELLVEWMVGQGYDVEQHVSRVLLPWGLIRNHLMHGMRLLEAVAASKQLASLHARAHGLLPAAPTPACTGARQDHPCQVSCTSHGARQSAVPACAACATCPHLSLRTSRWTSRRTSWPGSRGTWPCCGACGDWAAPCINASRSSRTPRRTGAMRRSCGGCTTAACWWPATRAHLARRRRRTSSRKRMRKWKRKDTSVAT